jgi:hypothetical protein
VRKEKISVGFLCISKSPVGFYFILSFAQAKETNNNKKPLL